MKSLPDAKAEAENHLASLINLAISEGLLLAANPMLRDAVDAIAEYTIILATALTKQANETTKEAIDRLLND